MYAFVTPLVAPLLVGFKDTYICYFGLWHDPVTELMVCTIRDKAPHFVIKLLYDIKLMFFFCFVFLIGHITGLNPSVIKRQIS